MNGNDINEQIFEAVYYSVCELDYSIRNSVQRSVDNSIWMTVYRSLGNSVWDSIYKSVHKSLDDIIQEYEWN
jgi:hypothetical protein